MTSLELNEAQGLDAAQIRTHMEKLGYRRCPCRDFPVCKSLGNHTHHGSEDRDLTVPDAWGKALPDRRRMVELTLSLLAALAGTQSRSCSKKLTLECAPAPATQRLHLTTVPGWLATSSEIPALVGGRGGPRKRLGRSTCSAAVIFP